MFQTLVIKDLFVPLKPGIENTELFRRLFQGHVAVQMVGLAEGVF